MAPIASPSCRIAPDGSSVARALLRPAAAPGERWCMAGLFPHGVAPAVDTSDRVFVGTDGGDLVALDGASGATLWTRHTSLLGGAPAVDRAGRVVAAPVSGPVASLDAASGRLLWSRPLPKAHFVDAPQAGRDILILRSQEGMLYALDSASGAVRWTHPCDPPVAPAPRACGNGVVAVPNEREHRVTALAEKDGCTLWEMRLGGPADSFAGGDDGTVFVAWRRLVSGEACARWIPMVRAVRGGTGEVLWDRPLEDAPAWVETRLGGVADGCLVGSTRDGRVFGMAADSGAVRWMRPAGYGDLSVSPPVVGPRGRLYVTEGGRAVHRFAAGTGAWGRDLPAGDGSTVSAPGVGPDGAVYVADDAGRLRAAGMETVRVEEIAAARPDPRRHELRVDGGWVVADGVRIPRR